ncbi:MAG TPA: cupredoxin domain-containing protein [Myxococcaceae bacterium]|nr:cupredoxin domain-containing protein [Myxococcaceae bacterium]
MNFDKLLKILASVALAAVIGFGIRAMAGDEKKAPAPAQAPEKPKARTVELKVTEKGFEPTPVTVKKGEPLRLQVTRTTDETCAKEMILPDYGIEKELPLNKAVDIEFTPTKAGKLKYGCSMGMMIAGVLIVE